MHNNFTMLGARSRAKLCLSQPYVFSNVLTPNINHCPSVGVKITLDNLT